MYLAIMKVIMFFNEVMQLQRRVTCIHCNIVLFVERLVSILWLMAVAGFSS